MPKGAHGTDHRSKCRFLSLKISYKAQQERPSSPMAVSKVVGPFLLKICQILELRPAIYHLSTKPHNNTIFQTLGQPFHQNSKAVHIDTALMF